MFAIDITEIIGLKSVIIKYLVLSYVNLICTTLLVYKIIIIYYIINILLHLCNNNFKLKTIN